MRVAVAKFEQKGNTREVAILHLKALVEPHGTSPPTTELLHPLHSNLFDFMFSLTTLGKNGANRYERILISHYLYVLHKLWPDITSFEIVPLNFQAINTLSLRFLYL